MIDGAAMVHTSYTESSIKTFIEYCEVQVTKMIQALARNVARVGIVFDLYRDLTVKQDTKDQRDTDGMCIMRRGTPFFSIKV